MLNYNYGKQSYFPTKLEWLAVYLNATFAPRDNDFFQYKFTPAASEQNTLIIFLFLKPRAATEKETLQRVIDTLKSQTELAIEKNFGWDWVKLEISKRQHPNFIAEIERALVLKQARLN